MPKEIKILIPDTAEGESVDINVLVHGQTVLQYKLEMFEYPMDKTALSRADFIKNIIDHYHKDFEVVEVGLDSQKKIPVLFRQLKS